MSKGSYWVTRPHFSWQRKLPKYMMTHHQLGAERGLIAKCSGLGGRLYTLTIEQIGTTLRADAGVYVFLRRVRSREWHPVYIGATDNLHQCLNASLTQHHRWDCIAKAGATHVGILRVRSNADRVRVQDELERTYRPVCNRQK